MDITKKEVFLILFELFNDCCVSVNTHNMDLYDESPDCVVDHDELMKRIGIHLKGGGAMKK